jgi:hypothetical protein
MPWNGGPVKLSDVPYDFVPRSWEEPPDVYEADHEEWCEDEDCEGGCIREPDYEQMEADRIEALYDRLGYEG